MNPLFADSRVWTEACPVSLSEARANRQLVLFAGNGVSVPTDRPSWFELVSDLLIAAQSAGISGPRAAAVNKLHEVSHEVAHNKLAPSVVRDLLDRFGGDAVYAHCLKTALEPVEAANASRIHSLLSVIRPKCIVTTNYDLCFERTFAEVGADWQTIIVESETITADYVLKENSIYHLHGATNPGESMILGLNDYTRFYRRSSGASAFLQHLFRDFTVLFIGCSMTDEEILGELLESRPLDRHHALTARESEQSYVFRSLGVPVTEYDCARDASNKITNHYGLERMLSRWVMEMNNLPDTGERKVVSQGE